MDKTAILQARFPTLGISVGYIGNVYGIIGTPACRDDRSYRVFTNLKDTLGSTVTIHIDSFDFDVEEIALKLQNIIVHRARMLREEDAANCPCMACSVRRDRRETIERMAEVALETARQTQKRCDERLDATNKARTLNARRANAARRRAYQEG